MDTSGEVDRRIAEVGATLGRLQYFWSRASVPKSWKIQVLSSVIKSKVLYAMESVRLSPSLEKRINYL